MMMKETNEFDGIDFLIQKHVTCWWPVHYSNTEGTCGASFLVTDKHVGFVLHECYWKTLILIQKWRIKR
jgi:hypothetical protein